MLFVPRISNETTTTTKHSDDHFNRHISGETCALQVFTRALSRVGISASLIHMALISGERYLAMRHSFPHFTLVTEPRLLVASVLVLLLSIILYINLAVNDRESALIMYSMVHASPLLSSVMLQFTGRFADSKTKLQLSKCRSKQGNNFKKIKRLSK